MVSEIRGFPMRNFLARAQYVVILSILANHEFISISCRWQQDISPLLPQSGDSATNYIIHISARLRLPQIHHK
jgi:hypothetical protein